MDIFPETIVTGATPGMLLTVFPQMIFLQGELWYLDTNKSPD